MALTPAWAVDGGKLPDTVLRMVAWCASSGATGIVQATDLRVTALSTPGGAVSIAPGGALMSDGYPGQAKGQTYAALNDAAEQLTIPATGSAGGRTDYVILKIVDWHQDGSQQPADPETALYCAFDRVSSLANLTFPYVALAKIVIPKSTATITDAMITDLRSVANPRQHTYLRPIPAVATDTGMTLVNADGTGEYFPNGDANHLGPTDIDIPEWATRAQIMCTWVGVLYARGENPYGRYWVEWGPQTAPSDRTYSTQKFPFDSPDGNNMRTDWLLGDEVGVPAAVRGTTQRFVPKATLNGNTGVSMDALSGMIWQVRFLEVADPGIS